MKKLVRRIVDHLARRFGEMLPDKVVSKFYATAARDVGILSTLTIYGEPMHLEKALESWKYWEMVYANRGFRPIDKKTLSERGFHGDSIDDLIGQRLEVLENPILYAPLYQAAFQDRKNRPGGWGGVLSKMLEDDFSKDVYYSGPNELNR